MLVKNVVSRDTMQCVQCDAGPERVDNESLKIHKAGILLEVEVVAEAKVHRYIRTSGTEEEIN